MNRKTVFLRGILIIIAAIMWGIDGTLLTPSYFSKFHFYDVKFIVFISHAIPTLILSILFTKEYKHLKSFRKSDYIYFILISLFGGAIGTLSIVKALQLSEFNPFSIVILVQKTQPIFAILLAYFLLKERPAKNFYLLAFISLICIYFLTFELKSPVLLPKNNLLAVIYSLIAAFSFGSSTVFGKKITSRFSNLTSTFYRFFFTTIITSIFLIFSKNSIDSFNIFIKNKELFNFSTFIALYGLIAIILYYKGLKHVSASVSTFCELAFPITSVIIEALFLKKFLSPIQTISAIILIIIILYLNLGKIKITTSQNN